MNRPMTVRLRRLRGSASVRRMLGVSLPPLSKFIWPVFVKDGVGSEEPIAAMPGQARMSSDRLCATLEPLVKQGLGGILLFGVVDPQHKCADGAHAYAEAGLVQRTIQDVKRAFPELLLFTDVCLCGYTDHGHCGPIDESGCVDNDLTNSLLAQVAVSHARAGADAVAPSAMMDGQVRSIRQALDDASFQHTIIMSYSTKFASSLYGPFREAAASAPGQGSRDTYQAPCNDLRQAIRESRIDEEEGADILMVKPAIFYLDVLAEIRRQTELPLAAYSVSGEYSMLMALAKEGGGELKALVRESVLSMVRAGADIIISYWANQYREMLGEGES